MKHILFSLTVASVLALNVASAHADIFGNGGDAFTIDFVTIGGPGNPSVARAMRTSRCGLPTLSLMRQDDSPTGESVCERQKTLLQPGPHGSVPVLTEEVLLLIK